MRTPQLLHSLVCAPRQLHSEVHAAALVLAATLGVEANPDRGGVRYDGDKLFPVLDIYIYIYIYIYI
jgi:hypothetical protein